MTSAEFNAGVTRICDQLSRIADLLAVFTLPPAEAPEIDGCIHPDDQRIDFGITDGHPDFQCRACGYRASEAGL